MDSLMIPSASSIWKLETTSGGEMRTMPVRLDLSCEQSSLAELTTWGGVKDMRVIAYQKPLPLHQFTQLNARVPICH